MLCLHAAQEYKKLRALSSSLSSQNSLRERGQPCHCPRCATSRFVTTKLSFDADIISKCDDYRSPAVLIVPSYDLRTLLS